jgi:hypothetical protein
MARNRDSYRDRNADIKENRATRSVNHPGTGNHKRCCEISIESQQNTATKNFRGQNTAPPNVIRNLGNVRAGRRGVVARPAATAGRDIQAVEAQARQA